MTLPLALGAVVLCATASYGGSLVGAHAVRDIQPGHHAPPVGHVPLPLLIAGAAAVGVAQEARGALGIEVGLTALLIFALSASWTTDVTRGLVFDAFTLAPLAALLLVGVVRGHWSLPVSALVLAAPFALTALLTRGRGMGWGDVELAALGGAVLGIQMAALLFALVSLAAFGAAMLRRKRGPIAFAPYLITAIAAGLALGGPF
ncbi:hypothetical protein EPN44_15140 [bacterium]|nr:MAG: hypothetical protein EPN44_15140 [bacterium]